jgi:hypothetical protein
MGLDRTFAIAQDWRTPAHCISATEDICCFRTRLLGNGKLFVFKRRPLAPQSRRPLPEGRLSLMRFSGSGVEKKRLLRTEAMQKSNEIDGLKEILTPKS